jgi:drug/metabolite transporter (DMT)-like permease
VAYSSNYLADAYEDVSSSAQASHGFVRTMFAATFPLLTHSLYEGLGYPIASTTVASIALVLASAPLFITVYGARLRERSKVTSALTNGQF